MSWDYRVDADGRLEIIISRWYCQRPPEGKGERVIRLWADGFEPNEPVQVEICGEEED